MPVKRDNEKERAKRKAERAARALAAGRTPGLEKAPLSLDLPATPRVPRIVEREIPGELPREHWPELRRVVEYRIFSLAKYRRSATVGMNRSSLRLALAELPERPSPDDIWRWAASLNDAPPKGAGLKASTVNRYKAHLGAAYEWCRKRGLYTANPCAGLPDLQEPDAATENAPGAFGGAQAAVELYERLRAVLTEPDERLFLALLRFLGLTREELFGLDECDFDPRSWTLSIQRGQRPGLDKSAKELKTQSRRRAFLLPEFLPDRELRELVAYVRTPRVKGRPYGEREPGAMASYEPTTRIFPWSRYRVETFMRKLHAFAPDVFGAMDRNDREHRPLHLWRHSFAETAADFLAETDAPRMMLKVQKLLGHSSLSSTEKYLRKRRGTGLRPGEAAGMRDALATGRLPGAASAPVLAAVSSVSVSSVDGGISRRQGGVNKGQGRQSQRKGGSQNPG